MKKCWAICLIALTAEVLAITWRWEQSPTDSLRAWYEGSFRAYFVESFVPWLIIFTVLTLLWLLINKKNHPVNK